MLKTGSDPGRCRYKDHEDANHKGPWKYSKVGKKYAELRPDRPSLDFRHKLNADGTKLIDRPYDETSASKTPKSDKKDGGKKGTVLSLCTSCTDDVELDIFLIKAVLSYRDQEGITAITLLDPGARSW